MMGGCPRPRARGRARAPPERGEACQAGVSGKGSLSPTSLGGVSGLAVAKPEWGSRPAPPSGQYGFGADPLSHNSC